MAKADTVLADLQAAAAGLLFPSESEAPVEAFVWPGAAGPPDEAALRANAPVPAGAAVARTTLDRLRRTIPSESRAEFRPLFDALGKLADLAVFKVGEVEVAVYVVGRTADGRYAGVKTAVVET